MSLNGINSNYQAYETNTVSGSDKKVSTKEISKTTAYSGVAATYEHASQSEGLVAAVNKKASNASIVAKLKADQETRMAQMQSLVTKMFSKQGITIGTADDMWKALAGGNFTADADTIAQAKEDISENGYWGVKQTSERIFSFAQALAGDDEEKMTKMKEAFEKVLKKPLKHGARNSLIFPRTQEMLFLRNSTITLPVRIHNQT